MNGVRSFRGSTVSISTGAPPTRRLSEIYLATTARCMQFYSFEVPTPDGENAWDLVDQLDRSKLVAAGDMATAKQWAKWLKLKSWTYVRV